VRLAEDKPLSTEELLDQLRQGSATAFETVFRAYYRQVFATAYRLLGSTQEAEDMAQEVFLRLYLRPLPPGRQHNLLGWLLRVTTNLAYNLARDQRRRSARENRALVDLQEDLEGEPIEIGRGAETAREVREVLRQLSERQAQLLLLRQAGLSYAELAAAVGVAEGSVGTLLARAERAFRAKYAASAESAAVERGGEKSHP
jgi:RNA polymerase sigma-70 factor (ECF subfamily)